MKPHPRIRKTIKWGGAVVTVLLGGVWIASGFGWCVCVASSRDWYVGCTLGGACYQYFPSFLHGVRPGTSWGVRPDGWSVEAWPAIEQFPGFFELTVPFWMPGVVVAVATAVAWRLDTLARRRAKLNLCPKCGYDRTGILNDAKCPECGSVGLPA